MTPVTLRVFFVLHCVLGPLPRGRILTRAHLDRRGSTVTDILIENATVITMDPERRIIEDGAVAIEGTRIAAVGPKDEVRRAIEGASAGPPAQVIDGRNMVALPGLIDAHSHAGHGLVKSLGDGDSDAWFKACETIYTTASSESFWAAEAALAGLERLKGGITCGVSLLGGGADIHRTDHPAFGGAHCRAFAELGLRSILAVGPGRPPFPRRFHRLEEGAAGAREISFERQLEVSEELVLSWHGAEDGRIGICLVFPVYHGDPARDGAERDALAAMAESTLALRARHGLLLTQDGHRSGSLAFCESLGLLGPWSLMSHSVDLTEGDIEACRRRSARIVHNPSAIASINGRCPVPELLDLGVTVVLGSDAAAPDRGYDMFRHMAQCMHYHRRHFRDSDVLPPEKLLEMTTIDSARALGLEAEIGSLEPGKRADVILVDLFKPHLLPLNMPVTRLAHFANAADVDTVIVDGRPLMRGRQVLSVDERGLLTAAQEEAEAMLARSGLEHLTRPAASNWGRSRRPSG